MLRATACALLLPFVALPAQGRPQFAPAVQKVEALAQELADAMNAGDKGLAATRREAFAAGVDELLAGKELLTTLDYNRTATIAMNVRCPLVCQKVARFTIEKLEQPGQLREFLGIANFELAQQATTDADMRRLCTEGAAALAIWCEAKPGSIGPAYLMQSYMVLGEWQKAIAWNERLKQRRSNIVLPPHGCALLHLGANQWDEALALLETPEVEEELEATEVDVLASRALASKGDFAAAVARLRLALQRKVGDAVVEALAETLACQGKYDEALAVLKQHPQQDKSEDRRVQAGLLKSRAVLEYLISLRGKRPADLRAQLGKRLEVKFVVHGMKEGDALGKTLAASPWALAYGLTHAPSGPASWASDLLFAVCVQDVGKYVQPDAEKKLMQALVDDSLRAALVGPDAFSVAKRNAETHVIRFEVPGALLVRRLLAGP